MTETEAAYLAGLIDGEGCIHAAMVKGRQRKEHHAPSVQLLLEVWNTNEEIIDYLHETFGGHRGMQDKRAEWKPVHFWRISIGGVRNVLPCLMPYLRIKREQAILAMELASVPSPKAFHSQPHEVQERREQLVKQIQAFNKRGRSHT